MEITPSLIYWIATLNAVTVLVGVTTCLSGLAFVISIVASCVTRLYGEDSLDYKIAAHIKKVAGIIFAISLPLAVFVPSSKTVAAMYVIPKVANSQKVQDVGNALGNLAIQWLKSLNNQKKNNE